MAILSQVGRIQKQVRRAVVLARVRAVARLSRSEVMLDVASDVEFGQRVRIKVDRGTKSCLSMARGCRIGDDVLILLKGGTIQLGPKVEIRRSSVLNVSGTLVLDGSNVISYANLIHCASSIRLAEFASTNEFCSLIDSTHHHDGPHEFFYENTSAAPIDIGPNVWICNKASVLMGVRIGANSVIASHSVVNRDVEAGVVVGGLPAKVLAKRNVAGPALRFFDVGMDAPAR